MASPVLVTGGTGRLGKLVVTRLQDSGCDVRVLARHDRRTRRASHSLPQTCGRARASSSAVTAAAAIIHCATSTRGDAEATRNLVAAASRTGSAHLVYVSIVGIDHIASWGYPKTKLQAEQIVASSGLPWTILRVTQFYDYCLTNAKKLSWFPVAPVPAGFTVQPVDPGDVAGRLVELALGEPVGRAPDMAGPQVSSWADLLRGLPDGQPSSPMGVAGPDTGHPGGPPRRPAATAGAHRRLPDLGPVPHRPTAPASHHDRLARAPGLPTTVDHAIRHPSSAIPPNAPRWPSPRLSPGSATGSIRCPTRYGTRRPATTTSQPWPTLVLWIAVVNVFNRVNVATRQVPGKHPG